MMDNVGGEGSDFCAGGWLHICLQLPQIRQQRPFKQSTPESQSVTLFVK